MVCPRARIRRTRARQMASQLPQRSCSAPRIAQSTPPVATRAAAAGARGAKRRRGVEACLPQRSSRCVRARARLHCLQPEGRVSPAAPSARLRWRRTVAAPMTRSGPGARQSVRAPRGAADGGARGGVGSAASRAPRPAAPAAVPWRAMCSPALQAGARWHRPRQARRAPQPQ